MLKRIFIATLVLSLSVPAFSEESQFVHDVGALEEPNSIVDSQTEVDAIEKNNDDENRAAEFYETLSEEQRRLLLDLAFYGEDTEGNITNRPGWLCRLFEGTWVRRKPCRVYLPKNTFGPKPE